MCRGSSTGNETWYLEQISPSEKLEFGLSKTYIFHGCSFSYKMCLSRKKLTSLFFKRTCANLTEQYNSVELKTFIKVLSLVSNLL